MKTAEQHNAEVFDLGKVIQSVAASHASLVDAATQTVEGYYRPGIRSLEKEFRKALGDKETKMPSSLQLAIIHVIALATASEEAA